MYLIYQLQEGKTKFLQFWLKHHRYCRYVKINDLTDASALCTDLLNGEVMIT